MVPAALPIREVISASMEPSAEMIEPRYVNEGTNSTSSPSIHKKALNQTMLTTETHITASFAKLWNTLL